MIFSELTAVQMYMFMLKLSVGFMVRRGHAGQVFILNKIFWPPIYSCTKISDPPSFSTSPPPPTLPCN
jgi:hypothetical protein